MNARGYSCAKDCNSSESQWLSGEQVRLCSGHPKVHFGTIVEGSWGTGGGGGGGGGGARWLLRAPSLIDLQPLSQCGSMYNSLSRSVSEMHNNGGGTLSNQETTEAVNSRFFLPAHVVLRFLAFCCSHRLSALPAHLPTFSRNPPQTVSFAEAEM